MKKILRLLLIYIYVINLSSPLSAETLGKKWPSVTPLKESFHFKDAANAGAKISISGVNGKPLYIIECHTYHYQDPDFDYSGDFECRLKSLYSLDAHSTLFSDVAKQTRDWESRARFLNQELVGKCANYPEYGSVRHFRLRGMEITLSVRNPKFEETIGMKRGRPQLKSFDFDIGVKPDRRATRSIAEPVPYIEPPFANPNDSNDFTLKCDKVLTKKR
jgi:hypothetical protein